MIDVSGLTSVFSLFYGETVENVVTSTDKPQHCYITMSLQKQRLDWFCLRMTLVLAVCWIPSSTAFGDIFVMNSSKIENDCVRFCGTSEVNQLFNSDCQRGCRFFDTFNTASMFVKFDDTAALVRCHQCVRQRNRKKTACSEGCTDAQKEYNTIQSMSIEWLEGLKSNMTFFQTLLDMTGVIVNPKRFVEEIPSSGKVRKNKTRLPANVNPSIKYEPQNTNSQKTVLKDETYKVRNPQSSTTVSDWIAQSAFILFTLGIAMLLGVCCYCCIFAHLLRRKQNKKIDSELPPSYEQLVRSSYIIVQPSLLNDYHLVKVDKKEESCSINMNSDTLTDNDLRSDNDEVRLPLRCEMQIE